MMMTSLIRVAMVIVLMAPTAAQNKTSQYLVVIVTDKQPVDEWTKMLKQSMNYTRSTVVNFTLSRIDTLVSDLCQNHSDELVIVLDTRSHINKDSLLFISEQLYLPYISVYRFLPPDHRWPQESDPKLPFDMSALSMRASLADYQDFFFDLIQMFNVSLDTITVMYDSQNKDLLSVFDSYGDQGPTFLLTYEVESVLRENFFKKLQTNMDIRDFVAIGPVSKLELLLEKAKESNMLTEFHRWMIVVTDNKPPTCANCTINITMVMPVSLSNMSRCNASSLYEVYLYDSIMLINKVITQMENISADFSEHRNICCPISGCKLKDITPTLKFMQEAVKGQYEGCTGTFNLDASSGHRQITFGLYQFDPKSNSTAEQIGYWNKSSGLVLTEPNSRYSSDWHLRKLRAITVIEPPFVIFENGTYTGYTIKVFTEIAKMNNLKYNITECIDKTYGSLLSDNTWGGCMGQILRGVSKRFGEADIIVGSLSVTTERESVVDFTLPYYDFAGIQILFQDPEDNDDLFSFMKVFHWDVWLCLAAVLLTTSILLHVFDRLSPFSDKDQLQNQRVFNLKESMWFVIGSLTQSGGGEPPTSFSSRVLVAGFWFFCIIMMSTFTANLAAFLTVKRITNDLNSLDDLAQSKVTYSVMYNTSVMRYFQRMANIEHELDKSWKQMSFQEDSSEHKKKSLAVWHYPISEKYANIWNKIKEYGMLTNTSEAIKRMEQGNFAYITESPIVQWYMSKDCKFKNIGEQFSSRPYAFALKQNSPLVSTFSSSILELQQKTMLDKYKNEWWKERNCQSNENANKGLDIKRLAGTFIVIGIGLGFGLLFLIIELVWNTYYFKKKKTSNGGLPETNVSTVFGKANSNFSNHRNGSDSFYSNPAFTEPKYE